MVPGREPLMARWVLFAGVQPLIYLDYDAIERLAENALANLSNRHLDINHVTLTLHGPGYGLDERDCLFALLHGLQNAIHAELVPQTLHCITIVERDKRRFGRLLESFKAFKSDRSPYVNRPNNIGTNIGGDATSVPLRKPQTAENLVFAAMPFSEQFEDVYHLAIQPAAHANSLRCERVDTSSFSGDIVERIKMGIEAASVIVGDLTTADPNVYLEIGYAWASRKPTILIARQGEQLKFDLRSQRCIFYGSIHKLQPTLRNEIKTILDQ